MAALGHLSRQAGQGVAEALGGPVLGVEEERLGGSALDHFAPVEDQRLVDPA